MVFLLKTFHGNECFQLINLKLNCVSIYKSVFKPEIIYITSRDRQLIIMPVMTCKFGVAKSDDT